ncbi:MAG: hypothetical protein K0S33_3947 [Bacteroidetes bacterium]|jgi:hypothetical protein|nr:hypothetical protein [Bacteroidota bacterium]
MNLSALISTFTGVFRANKVLVAEETGALREDNAGLAQKKRVLLKKKERSYLFYALSGSRNGGDPRINSSFPGRNARMLPKNGRYTEGNFQSFVKNVFVAGINLQHPVKYLLCPERNILSPVKNVFVAGINLQYPVKYLLRPERNILSVIKNVFAPGINLQYPVKYLLRPERNIQSPVKNAPAPGINLPDPVKNILCREKNILPPVKNAPAPGINLH